MTQVTLHQNGNTIFAELSGEIDHHSANHLRESIDARITAVLPSVCVLDFSSVTFMDSSGIGLILGRHKLVQSLGGTVVVQNAPRNIRRMLAIAGIEATDVKQQITK